MGERQMATAWFNTRLDRRCPSCRAAGPFHVGSHLVAAPLRTAAGYDFDTSAPAVLLVCAGCAQLRFFSATLMGLEPADAPAAAARAR